MKSIYVTLFLIFFLYNTQLFTNELKYATSPYLLQHADNPVEWMPWGQKAFQKAKDENKSVYLSIGYSTCHWCHVMEEESFTNKKIAALLNKYYVCIKVDREELPHLDSYYQNIYQKVTGHMGGWPLNIFMTPDKKVFYISNYIPPFKRLSIEGFDTLLIKLDKLYHNKKELIQAIRKFQKEQNRDKRYRVKPFSLASIANSLDKAYDSDYAGFGKNRQFPEAAKLTLMLDVAELRDSSSLKQHCFDMLDRMALGGLYDQVGGGFFRYSVDLEWEIPHFEKMLYTQAELIPLYQRAYLLSGKKLYKDIVDETIAMLSKRFEKESLYWSASDADSQGKEGAFFTFSKAEIQDALQENPYKEEIKNAMEFSYEGNFHERVHINFYTKKRPKGFFAFQKALQKIEATRSYPFIDKKINTAWNAMMIEALFQAAVLDKKYEKKAQKHLTALTNMMFDKGELYHQTIFGYKAKQKAFLEDYAFFIAALISAYETDFNEEHLDFADYLLNKAKEKFYKNGEWYLSEESYTIKADFNDKYYTSPQAKMIQNILKMALLRSSFRYEKFAQKSLNTLLQKIDKELDAVSLMRAYLMQQNGIIVIKSSKKNLQKNSYYIRQMKYPYIVVEAKEYSDYLLCSLHQCFAKQKSIAEIKKVIQKRKIFLY